MAAEALRAIEGLMKTSNKPQNVQSVINNTGSKFGKVAVQKALDALVHAEKVIYTEIGKTGKLYLWNQNLLPVLSDDELMRLNMEVVALKERTQALAADDARLREELEGIVSLPTTADLHAEVARLEEEVAANREKIAVIKGSGALLSDADMNKINRRYKEAMTGWSQRRAKCQEVIDMVCDGMGKRPLEFMEELDMTQDTRFDEYKAFRTAIPPVTVAPPGKQKR